MSISLFDLFSIGIGPSSSHTVGPMYAACEFVQQLEQDRLLDKIVSIQVDIYGSLALTGVGHGTDKAILNGLEGKNPETVNPETMFPRMNSIKEDKTLSLNGKKNIPFDFKKDFLFHQKEFLPKHSNGMRFTAYDSEKNTLKTQIYYSIGGGFYVTDEKFGVEEKSDGKLLPYSFKTAQELIEHCHANNLKISEVMLANERTWRNDEEIKEGILKIAGVMEACIENGCKNKGILPGGLEVKRRAPDLYQRLIEHKGIPSIFIERCAD